MRAEAIAITGCAYRGPANQGAYADKRARVAAGGRALAAPGHRVADKLSRSADERGSRRSAAQHDEEFVRFGLIGSQQRTIFDCDKGCATVPGQMPASAAICLRPDARLRSGSAFPFPGPRVEIAGVMSGRDRAMAEPKLERRPLAATDGDRASRVIRRDIRRAWRGGHGWAQQAAPTPSTTAGRCPDSLGGFLEHSTTIAFAGMVERESAASHRML